MRAVYTHSQDDQLKAAAQVLEDAMGDSQRESCRASPPNVDRTRQSGTICSGGDVKKVGANA
jgi:hypothetical protein